MKRFAAILLVAVMAVSLVACGGGGGKKTESKPDSTSNETKADFTPVAGSTFDTGMFTVTVPNGWLAVPASDTFDQYDGDTDPTTLSLVKDGKEEWDAFDHAVVRIALYDKGTMVSGKDWYDDVKDMDAVELSGFKFERYSCLSSGYPYIMLEGTGAKNDAQISILTKNDLNSLEYDDADVQTILRSIAVK